MILLLYLIELENICFFKEKEFNSLVNNALNSTLSRTVNTSLTTFFVLLVIFLFGGYFVDLCLP